uniref:Kinesin motor domain-containing protein n=1 Tax=Euplotes harpa TaxID=151035 RepID=A0A7S3J3X7_9SPIT|mmetsp:Transcript_18783/g.21595  ORF Transcript_18783/g.21595 Transcript_18783/m.21595 type:complete len:794 (+) Transcript_18783:903-3284(+)
MCIKALTDNSSHVPFRDSKLTMFLKQSLGGNSKTLLICTASALERHYEESYQTCRFAKRAKQVKNKATSNIMRSREEMEAFIIKLKAEVAALKKQLISNGIKPDPKAFRDKADGAIEEKADEEDKEDKEDKEDNEDKDDDDKDDEEAKTPVEVPFAISTELEGKLEELQNAYDTYKDNAQKRIQELEDLVEKAEEERVDLDNYREKDFEIESLISTVDEKEEIISQLQKEKDKDKIKFESEIAELDTRLKNLTTDHETLLNDLKEIKELNEQKLVEQSLQIHQLTEENTKLKEDYSTLSSTSQSQIDSMQKDLSELKSSVEELSAKEKKLKGLVEEKEAEIDSTNKKCEELSIELFEADEHLEEEKRKVSKLAKVEEDLKNEIEEKKQATIRKEDELKSYQTKLLLEKEELRIQIMELDRKIEQMEVAINNDDTKVILEQKDETIKALKLELQEKVEKLQNEKDEEVKKVKDEIEAITQDRDTLKASLKELENNRADLVAKISKLENRKTNLEEKIDSQAKEISKLSESIQTLKDEITSNEASLEKKEETIKGLRVELDAFNSSASDLEARAKALQESSKQDTEQLKKELSELKVENIHLKSKADQLEQAQKEIERNAERYDAARAESMKNSEALSKSEAENAELKRQIQKLIDANDTLKKKMSQIAANSEKQQRTSVVAIMNLKKTIAQKIKAPVITSDDEETEEVHEGIVSGPFTRKNTIIRKKVKFNNQVIDPSILNKPDWELTAQEKYHKSILEHYENMRKQEEKGKKKNYRDSNIENYGKDIVYGDED